MTIILGTFDRMESDDVEDFYLDISDRLDEGDTVSGVAFTCTDEEGDTVTGMVTNQTISGGRVVFRIAAPTTAGEYSIEAVFTISDGQQITRTAKLPVV